MRRLLTATITLGAITAGVLGVNAPAHAMIRACEANATGCGADGTNPDVAQPAAVAPDAVQPDAAQPAAVQPLDMLIPDAWEVIFGNLPEKSLAQLDQVDTQLHQLVTDHHDNLQPNAHGFVYTHTSEQLDQALAERSQRNITKLGIAHTLTEGQQAAITAALQKDELTNVVLVNGASLLTVNGGRVHVGNGGTITTVTSGKVFVAAGGNVTTVDGGTVQLGSANTPGGTVTTVNNGMVHVNPGGTVTTVDGGRVGVGNGGTVTTVNNGTVGVHAGGNVTTVDGGTVQLGAANFPGGTVTTV
ncbi:MAG: hypothetical protein H0T78_02715, partial [Longispora sp.]|nr:hypothetical protein [Longispora sp. (in: high G+C Gram-positive bacteria)]